MWLSERQLDCGGLNGRPMKKEDVCYSWWALSSLVMLGKSKLINAEKLRDFILSSQVSQLFPNTVKYYFEIIRFYKINYSRVNFLGTNFLGTNAIFEKSLL